MNSREALREFQKIIQKDPRVLEFCSREQKWIDTRKQDWEFDRIRAGVIGVTSSGKSTLINAILGRELLSSAVVPSSSQLVCCSYGKNTEALVCFQNGKTKRLAGDALKELCEYSDERNNPSNRKGVLSIELSTPAFDLGKDVLLIDSPGLDAYGLEAHEKLTLESLVPTVDVCIYVTTTKQNTDQKTKTVLDSVAKYNCPIIIVQNMLDAVRASPSGDKTREQVAEDHRRRVMKIVENTAISDKNAVKIIQMSAKFASQWRCHPHSENRTDAAWENYQKSNYVGFSTSVRAILERQRPRIERQRLESIWGQAAELSTILEERISVQTRQRVDWTFPLASFREEFHAEIEKLKEQYTRAFTRYDDASKRIKELLPGEENAQGAARYFAAIKTIADILNGGRKQQLEQLVQSTNAAVSDLGKDLTELVSDCTAAIMRAADRVNIPGRDLLRSTLIPSHRDIHTEQKVVQKRKRVEKTDGPFGGKVARFFGGLFDNDWGYTYRNVEELEVDEEATRKKILDRLDTAWNRYRKTMEQWSDSSFDPAVDRILEEIDEKEDAYNRQREMAIQAEALRALRSSLRDLMRRIEEGMPAEKVGDVPNTAPFQKEKKKIEIPAYSKAILELSQQALQVQHRSFFRTFVEKIGCMQHSPVIISWDAASQERFLWQSGIAKPQCLSPEGKVQLSAGSTPRCVFVLVNTTQFGEAMKQIVSLQLDKSLTDKDYVVWVVQDFQELLNGGHAAEGLEEMGRLSELTKMPCASMIYIRHENPLYGWAFLELQMEPGLAKNPHFLIRDIQEKYADYTEASLEKTLAQLLRNAHIVRK